MRVHADTLRLEIYKRQYSSGEIKSKAAFAKSSIGKDLFPSINH